MYIGFFSGITECHCDKTPSISSCFFFFRKIHYVRSYYFKLTFCLYHRIRHTKYISNLFRFISWKLLKFVIYIYTSMYIYMKTRKEWNGWLDVLNLSLRRNGHEISLLYKYFYLPVITFKRKSLTILLLCSWQFSFLYFIYNNNTYHNFIVHILIFFFVFFFRASHFEYIKLYIRLPAHIFLYIYMYLCVCTTFGAFSLHQNPL